MQHTIPVKINALIENVAKQKAEHLEVIVNTLEVDNLAFFAKLCKDKGKALNASIRGNQTLIEKSL
jgi:hypothetical protein